MDTPQLFSIVPVQKRELGVVHAALLMSEAGGGHTPASQSPAGLAPQIHEPLSHRQSCPEPEHASP
jgi:hypothetical protein